VPAFVRCFRIASAGEGGHAAIEARSGRADNRPTETAPAGG
jgi:hypothetical protein